MTFSANNLIALFSSPRKFILEIDALDSSIAQHCKSKFPKVRYTPFDRVIDVYIKNLRKKLHLDCIITVKGVGYRYEAA